MRAWIYDKAILGLTAGWYRKVLDRLPTEASILDVGIGTGSALFKNAAMLREKSLDVVGVDIDEDYVKRCQRGIWRDDLTRHVRVYLQSVYDHDGGPYDAVYFSASFMLLPDPQAALRHVGTLLKPGGQVYFTQTFEEQRSRLMETVKPLLGQLTTIEFGQVTYESDFLKTVSEGGLEITDLETIGSSGKRTYRLAIGTMRAPRQDPNPETGSP